MNHADIVGSLHGGFIEAGVCLASVGWLELSSRNFPKLKIIC